MNRHSFANSTTLAFATLALFATTSALAQINLPDASKGTGTVRETLKPSSDIGPNGSCREMQPSSTLKRTLVFDGENNELDIFDPKNARDVMATFANRGNVPVRIEIQAERGQRPIFETLDPGATLLREFSAVDDMIATCGATGREGCEVDVEIVSVLALPGIQIEPKFWYPGPVMSGTADFPPDSWDDCLWEQDLMWTSDQGRNIDLFIQNQGLHDVEIEFEYSNNTFWSHTVHSTSALPQFQTLSHEDEDVIAVRTKCQREPSNPCGNCVFDYSLTVLP